MAYVFQRGSVWYAGYTDAEGNRVKVACPEGTRKSEARRLAEEAERAEKDRAAKIKLGLISPNDFDTFGAMADWWLAEYSRGDGDKPRPGHQAHVGYLGKHLLPAFGTLPPAAVTPERIEEMLHGLRGSLAPQTLNHLRGIISRIYNKAIRRGRFLGANPCVRVERAKIPRRPPAFLRPEEASALLGSPDTTADWRGIFAVALYLGLRKGEIFGLRKSDVDLERRTLTVSRSYDNDESTHKGGHAETLPIPDELMPHLRAAIDGSTSDYVFPDTSGDVRSRHTRAELRLRSALARAGIVDGWEHVCRRQGCAQEPIRAEDDKERLCPICSMILWPRAIHKRIRFHDLRHTTASLLIMAGAPLPVVQTIMRHTDPKITMGIYTHLLPDYLRDGANRLRLVPEVEVPVEQKKA